MSARRLAYWPSLSGVGEFPDKPPSAIPDICFSSLPTGATLVLGNTGASDTDAPDEPSHWDGKSQTATSYNEVVGSMSSLGSRRMLVVDDCTDAADSLSELLTLWGYNAEACYDRAAALETARAYRPRVVLLDVSLPGVDGFQVALGLRVMPELAETTVNWVTGYADEAC